MDSLAKRIASHLLAQTEPFISATIQNEILLHWIALMKPKTVSKMVRDVYSKADIVYLLKLPMDNQRMYLISAIRFQILEIERNGCPNTIDTSLGNKYILAKELASHEPSKAKEIYLQATKLWVCNMAFVRGSDIEDEAKELGFVYQEWNLHNHVDYLLKISFKLLDDREKPFDFDQWRTEDAFLYL